MKKTKILINNTVVASLSTVEMQELSLLKGILPENLDSKILTEQEKEACKNYNDYLDILVKKRGSKNVNIVEHHSSIELHR